MSNEISDSIEVVLPDGLSETIAALDVAVMLCHECVEDAQVDVAGVMLPTTTDSLQLVASSSESPRILELFELQLREGPSAACFQNGPIVNHLFSADDEKWPLLASRALEQGFSTMHCIPMRMNEQTIGVLNCFASNERWLGDHDLALVQNMADIATVAICETESALKAQKLNLQLSYALESRVVIEQAKGVVSHSTNGNIEEAFRQIRLYARNHNLGLTTVAHSIRTGSLSANDILQANANFKKAK